MKKREYVWCICHIDNKLYGSIEAELKEAKYDDIKVYIPTLSILKKRSKGKDIYEDVPMLFSYGFIRMRKEKAFSRVFLHRLKKAIPGIHSWVKSPETMHQRKIKARIQNAEDWDDFSIVATVSRKEIRRLKRLSKENKVYSKYDIAQLTVGSYIVLRGYPFDGVQATVLEINLNTQNVKVKLFPNGGEIEIWLPFENVLYSTYLDYDPDKLAYDHAEDNISNSYKLTTTQEEDSLWMD